jgi:ribosome biogenesis GTPase
MVRLKALGFNTKLEKFRIEHNLDHFAIGRVIAEHKERYIVSAEKGDFAAEITGNMRFTATSREDFPAVGDWVALTPYDDSFAIIHGILPRSSIIKRQAIGQFGMIQIIAANIDYAFLVQAVDRDHNINRLERYLTLCHSSRVKPIIVLTKTDLTDESRTNEIISSIKARIRNVPVIAISNETQQGFDELDTFIKKGKTYCMLGSSGVGKSTLLNNLAGRTIMSTDIISQSTSKGKHVTSHRELVMLKNGGLLIDNPGMREVGIADALNGLEITFDIIVSLAQKCKFKDCTHTSEIGCRVIEAVEKGEIDSASYENFLKIEKERAYFESTVQERRLKDRKFGKMIKNYKKDLKKTTDS